MATTVRTTHGSVSPVEDTVLLIARILLGWIFVRSGFGKLMDLGGFSGYLGKMNVPMPQAIGLVAAVVEFVGGLAVLLGFRVRYASLLLALFVIVATALAHRYWEFTEAAVRRTQDIMFYKNVAIVGGLFALYVTDSGRFSVDAFRRK